MAVAQNSRKRIRTGIILLVAITTAQATSSTVVQLQNKVRFAVADVDTVSANQRFSDAQINYAINFELAKMASELGLHSQGSFIESASLTYSGSSTALPAGPATQPILFVEDITSGNAVRLEQISVLDTDKLADDQSFAFGAATYAWHLLGDSIAIRPEPGSTLSLRVWYFREPYVFNLDSNGDEVTATDQQPFPVQHEELLVLGAAIRLQEVDEEIPGGRMQRYDDLWFRFVQTSARARGVQYVRSNRRLR